MVRVTEVRGDPRGLAAGYIGGRIALAARKGRDTAATIALGLSLIVGCASGTKKGPGEIAAVAVSGPTWEAGRRYAYDLEMSSKLTVAGGKMFALMLRSEVMLDSRRTTAGATEFLVSMPEPKFETADPEARAQFDTLAAELRRGFGFTLALGKLTEVRFMPGWSPFAASIARALAAQFQFADQGQTANKVWTAQELDGTGTYDAEYRSSAADGVIEKRKLRYQPISIGKAGIGNFSPKLTPEVVSSKGSLRLSAGTSTTASRVKNARRLERLDYDEQVKTQLTPTSVVTSDTHIRLSFKQEKAEGVSDWAARLAGTTPLAPNAPHGAPVPTTNYDPMRIGNYTFESALKELEHQAADPKGNLLFEKVRGEPEAPEQLPEREARLRERGRVFTAMAALIRSDPKNVKLAVRKIREKSPAQRTLLDALSSAGTPLAQASLVESMEDPSLDNALHRAAAFSLIRSERATPESVAALERHLEASDLLRLHALYGLGTICRHLREAGEPARADAIAAVLQRALQSSSKPGEQVDVLRGIANSGHPAAFDSVRPYLDSETGKVRAAAIDALRLMPRSEVDALVAQHLEKETSDVQTAALEAISVRDPSPVLIQALENAAKTAEASNVRVKAVRIMGEWLPKRPELKQMLLELAQKDEKEQVRKAAKAALGS